MQQRYVFHSKKLGTTLVPQIHNSALEIQHQNNYLVQRSKFEALLVYVPGISHTVEKRNQTEHAIRKLQIKQ